jgi:hypothetical protein
MNKHHREIHADAVPNHEQGGAAIEPGGAFPFGTPTNPVRWIIGITRAIVTFIMQICRYLKPSINTRKSAVGRNVCCVVQSTNHAHLFC